jgi:ribonuclease HI
MMHKTARKHQTNEVEEVNHYRNPQQGFIKLNFDGAAKGNPGEAGTGGVFRDDRGRTLRIYAMDCGNATNNEAELHALKKGLEIAIREEYQKLQVEGDSKMVVDIVKQLQQGTQCGENQP